MMCRRTSRLYPRRQRRSLRCQIPIRAPKIRKGAGWNGLPTSPAKRTAAPCTPTANTRSGSPNPYSGQARCSGWIRNHVSAVLVDTENQPATTPTPKNVTLGVSSDCARRDRIGHSGPMLLDAGRQLRRPENKKIVEVGCRRRLPWRPAISRHFAGDSEKVDLRTRASENRVVY
jgi:hypothetical protein